MTDEAPATDQLQSVVEAVFTERPGEKLTYSQVCYAIGEKRKAGLLLKVSPTFSACKQACEDLSASGRLTKEVQGRATRYGRT